MLAARSAEPTLPSESRFYAEPSGGVLLMWGGSWNPDAQSVVGNRAGLKSLHAADVESLRLGYRLNHWLSIEAEGLRLGSWRESMEVLPQGGAFTSVSLDGLGGGLNLVASRNFGRSLSLFVGAGYSWIHYRVRGDFVFANVQAYWYRIGQDDRMPKLTAGLGYRLSDRTSLRFMVEQLFPDSLPVYRRPRMTSLSLGLAIGL